MVKRSIKREGNKSSFWVNSQPSNKNKVSELCQRLSIQVDNLCQFLPQEKVSEFARMDPVFLLHETQRAVGKPEMLKWHDSLKSLRKEQKKLQSDTKVNKELLDRAEKRQELAAADVQRMQEREKIQKKVKLLEECRPLSKYKEAQARAEELKQRRVDATAECDALKRSVEPALRAVNAKQKYKQEVELEAARRKKKVEKVERDTKARRDEIATFDDTAKDFEHQFNKEKEKLKGLKEEERRTNLIIKKLNDQINQPPAEFDAAAYNEKIVSVIRTTLALAY